jgi:hypothetical protein
LEIGPNFFLQHIKNKIIFSFVKFVATKNGLTKKNFSPLSFVAVFGSGIRDSGSRMGKIQDPGSGIKIPDPPHCLKLAKKKRRQTFRSVSYVHTSHTILGGALNLKFTR